jgi:hypothetical protein
MNYLLISESNLKLKKYEESLKFLLLSFNYLKFFEKEFILSNQIYSKYYYSINNFNESEKILNEQYEKILKLNDFILLSYNYYYLGKIFNFFLYYKYK